MRFIDYEEEIKFDFLIYKLKILEVEEKIRRLIV